MHPLLGRNAAAAPGSTSFVVNITKQLDRRLTGELVLLRDIASGGHSQELLRSAIHLPENQLAGAFILRVTSGEETRVLVQVRDGNGAMLGQAKTQLRDARAPFLFELTSTPTLASRLDGKLLPQPPGTVAGGATFPVAVSHPPLFRGKAAFPSRVTDYSAVSLVTATSTELASLNAAELTALSHWLAAGGALAISLDQSAHCSQRPITDFVGGICEDNPPGEGLLATPQLRFSSVRHSSDPGDMTIKAVSLPPELRPQLSTRLGANLHADAWGSVAAYGLGEVHLLGFDYQRPEFTEAEWTHVRLLDLVAHTIERRRAQLLPLGRQAATTARGEALHALLTHRRAPLWLVYSAIALITLFSLSIIGVTSARRWKDTPRNITDLASQLGRAIFLTAATCAAMIYLKHLDPRSRPSAQHITLLEAGAGVNIAKINRYRNIHPERPEKLAAHAINPNNDIHAIDPMHWLRISHRMTGNRVQLTGIDAQPLTPIVLHEFGVAAIGRGLWIEEYEGNARVSNFLGRDLRSVVARSRAGELFFFERIADGQVTQISSGRRLRNHGTPPHGEENPLLGHLFFSLADEVTPGFSNALQAIAELAGDEVDYWPHDVPVVLAQLDGGEGIVRDQGMPVTASRTILRVVGYGTGTP